VVRDWLPAGLIILVYRQAGISAASTNTRFQAKLADFDEVLLPATKRLYGNRAGRGLSIYFEFAYLFCYPMVPLGLGVLYLTGMRPYVDRFWTLVLPPTYICYGTLPFLQILPPWLAQPGGRFSVPENPFRAFNFWIVDHLSIRVDTFPSAHVAASFATAMALFPLAPKIGIAFFWLALSIATASVIQRYHYAIDAFLGIAVAIGVFWLQTEML